MLWIPQSLTWKGGAMILNHSICIYVYTHIPNYMKCDCQLSPTVGLTWFRPDLILISAWSCLDLMISVGICVTLCCHVSCNVSWNVLPGSLWPPAPASTTSCCFAPSVATQRLANALSVVLPRAQWAPKHLPSENANCENLQNRNLNCISTYFNSRCAVPLTTSQACYALFATFKSSFLFSFWNIWLKSSTLYYKIYKATLLRIELNIAECVSECVGKKFSHLMASLALFLRQSASSIELGVMNVSSVSKGSTTQTSSSNETKETPTLQTPIFQCLAKRDQSWMQLSNIVDIVGLSKQCVCNAVWSTWLP